MRKVDIKIVPATYSKVPATETKVTCDNGFRLAYPVSTSSFVSGTYLGSNGVPNADVHYDGKYYNYYNEPESSHNAVCISESDNTTSGKKGHD